MVLINLYRIVNLFRLLRKYASIKNRNKLKKSLQDNQNYKTLIGEKSPRIVEPDTTR